MLCGTDKIYNEEGIIRMWVGYKPIVILYRPNEIEVILSSNTLTQKSSEYDFLKSWLGKSCWPIR